jgi:hypothetical protein
MESEKAAKFVYRLEKLQWTIPIDEIKPLRHTWLRFGYQTARLRLWFEGNGEVI